MRKTNSSPLGLVLLAVAAAGAQPPSGFDVASIKPSDPSSTRTQIGVAPGGVFNAKNVTLRLLIGQAWDLRDFQISGGPGWIDADHYDIMAKSPEFNVSEDDLRKMTDEQRNSFQDKVRHDLQLLLEDRFQLHTHRETRDLPVYTLTIAKNGSKLQAPANTDVTATSLRIRRTDAGLTEVTGKNTPLANLVKSLSSQLNRTVLDQSGLTGRYDFTVTFTPNLDAAQQPDTAGPSLFTALEEQLGLRLDSKKGPVEVLVIDSAQKASAN